MDTLARAIVDDERFRLGNLAALPNDLKKRIITRSGSEPDLPGLRAAISELDSRGWSFAQIKGLLDRHPEGVAKGLLGVLEDEILEIVTNPEPDGAVEEPFSPLPLHWHGDAVATGRRWLVRELIPETGKGLLVGQWGTGKSFVALDLCAAVMTDRPFAGKRIERHGGVLFVAAEGATEIPIRLLALVQQGEVDSEREPGDEWVPLPFAWLEECPPLLGSGDPISDLIDAAHAAASQLGRVFDLPLSLIVIDTLVAVAGFKSENDAAEGQRVMNALERLSRETGAFVLGVDHLGKSPDNGARGTSAKEAAADVVLAVLADRETGGPVSNTRLAVRKLRGGAAGSESPFALSVVALSGESEGTETSCVVEWGAAQVSSSTPTRRWPPTLRFFKDTLSAVLADRGRAFLPYLDGPEVRAVTTSALRTAFVADYPASSDDESHRADAARKAFGRFLAKAADQRLVVTREVDGELMVWFGDRSDEA